MEELFQDFKKLFVLKNASIIQSSNTSVEEQDSFIYMRNLLNTGGNQSLAIFLDTAFFIVKIILKKIFKEKKMFWEL